MVPCLYIIIAENNQTVVIYLASSTISPGKKPQTSADWRNDLKVAPKSLGTHKRPTILPQIIQLTETVGTEKYNNIIVEDTYSKGLLGCNTRKQWQHR